MRKTTITSLWESPHFCFFPKLPHCTQIKRRESEPTLIINNTSCAHTHIQTRGKWQRFNWALFLWWGSGEKTKSNTGLKLKHPFPDRVSLSKSWGLRLKSCLRVRLTGIIVMCQIPPEPETLNVYSLSETSWETPLILQGCTGRALTCMNVAE